MLSLSGTQNKVISVFGALLLMAGMAAATTKHASSTKSGKSSGKSTSSSKSGLKSRSGHKSTASKGKKGKKSKSAHKRGQQGITSDRTREIQAALIRERYLDGEPTGVWDDDTKRALIKLQNDNGWQTKIVPDSRALIKLGLGPSHEGLLNPDSAALSGPRELGVEREIPGGEVRGSMPRK